MYEKLDELKKYIKDKKKVCVAFSGGVDSTFLLKVATDILTRDNALGIFVNNSLQSEDDVKRARDIQKAYDFNVLEIELDPFLLEEFKENSNKRCYYCKQLIFDKISLYAKTEGFETILDGTNFDDTFEYRPGVKALEEAGIESPLRDCGLTKEDIRKLSAEMNLCTKDIESSPCLATRVPYGIKLEPMVLDKVDKCEVFLKVRGYKSVRVRAHGDIARIETDSKDFEKLITKDRSKIVDFFKRMGFNFVTLDLEGYRSGSFDKIDEAKNDKIDD